MNMEIREVIDVRINITINGIQYIGEVHSYTSEELDKVRLNLIKYATGDIEFIDFNIQGSKLILGKEVLKNAVFEIQSMMQTPIQRTSIVEQILRN